jgi:flagellum-specific peptidoglycan hydrolase FlgJ
MYIIKKHFAKYKSVDAAIDKDANIINYNKKITHSLYKQTQFPPKLTKQATKEQTRQRKKYDTDTEMMFGSIR